MYTELSSRKITENKRWNCTGRTGKKICRSCGNSSQNEKQYREQRGKSLFERAAALQKALLEEDKKETGKLYAMFSDLFGKLIDILSYLDIG
ncbi:hypothetical protein Cst_c09020 [Thermoclostridium stercorarium subsp. stercorarium DSM 8532]|jgi:hypothetical protein|uniref:Uncharacterized protein n=3 Tax=Thermoclostridium stercorarium TaxID=1510 RepID=L7VIL1_THES1|nr:hypothetical protein [Thermoclostridium stercorarium]AGC67900.1 hypothetical protein Cst_c09020 [Thermoclostridium stercorarium subsp. stercorarium DSM 8532]ANW98309.1 hypothetical protein CSTERTH_04285 [Thermoclostridium stercorarium subsp. thermolacticum DSM 2910]ANX00836.1 hypothetical protein CSTERLE_04190 [Thermoclostridium stercorarium subsp. leptospartum DSM 9219]